MTIMTVIRDADGRVINIGPWDEIASGPLPAGATQADEAVVIGWDDGLYAADDPRRLGPP